MSPGHATRCPDAAGDPPHCGTAHRRPGSPGQGGSNARSMTHRGIRPQTAHDHCGARSRCCATPRAATTGDVRIRCASPRAATTALGPNAARGRDPPTGHHRCRCRWDATQCRWPTNPADLRWTSPPRRTHLTRTAVDPNQAPASSPRTAGSNWRTAGSSRWAVESPTRDSRPNAACQSSRTEDATPSSHCPYPIPMHHGTHSMTLVTLPSHWRNCEGIPHWTARHS